MSDTPTPLSDGTPTRSDILALAEEVRQSREQVSKLMNAMRLAPSSVAQPKSMDYQINQLSWSMQGSRNDRVDERLDAIEKALEQLQAAAQGKALQ